MPLTCGHLGITTRRDLAGSIGWNCAFPYLDKMVFPFSSISGGPMVLKDLFISLVCAMLLAWSGLSVADEYRPDEFLGLDLSKAVLSPNPLGPPSQFAPVPVEARADRGGEVAPAPAEAKAEPKIVIHKTRVVHARAEKPRAPARTKLARRHGNPLDAQAFDTRIQVWPCQSGGICNWRR
jgi:hypothetical protein